MGVQVATGENEILTSADHTYAFNTENGIDWVEGISIHNELGNTQKGDVSINNGVSAVGYMGRNVHVYPTTKYNKPNQYYTRVVPSATVLSETAEDISFDRDQLLVKQGTSEAAFIYDFPCGHGIELVENSPS